MSAPSLAQLDATAATQKTGVELTNPASVVYTTSGGGSQSQSSSSFEGISNPEALQVLLKYITDMANGGTEEQKAQLAERKKQIDSARATLNDYTKSKAYQDAQLSVDQALRQALEKNMPTIQKAIRGAGTSSSAMQGLLATKLSTESAQAAGALGATQAAQYGSISANLQSVLENLTKIDPTISNALINALSLTKTSSSQSQASSTTNPNTTATAVPQGTYWYDFGNTSGANSSGQYPIVTSPVQSNAKPEGYVVKNSSGPQADAYFTDMAAAIGGSSYSPYDWGSY